MRAVGLAREAGICGSRVYSRTRSRPLSACARLPSSRIVLILGEVGRSPRARICHCVTKIKDSDFIRSACAIARFQCWPRYPHLLRSRVRVVAQHNLPSYQRVSIPAYSQLASFNVGLVACTHFLHARGYPLPALGVLSAPAPFPCAGSRPNSSVGYVARTYFPHARGCPLHALGALPAHSLHSRVDAIASFQRWPRCPHPLPARTWLSSSSVGSIVHTRSVPACARLAFRQFPPGKINTKPHANASRGRRRFAARPVRAVAPDISRQLYFQRADFVPPVLHRA